MYISSFHIDGFGKLSNVNVEDLPSGISIFLGCNEAGKSTCLEFLRAMLTGFQKDLNEKYHPMANVKAGGSLLINYETETRRLDRIRITRRPGRNGGLFLHDEEGNLLPEDRLGKIFSGISPQVYRKVFGFSLGELETFESLSDEGVRNALYGASFGPGLVSPAEALKNLKNRKDKIFKAGASKLPLNAALKELEEIRKTIREREDNNATYDQLCQATEHKREELIRLRGLRNDLEIQRRLLERRLSVWQLQEQWRKIKDRLEHMPELPSSFPEEALQRLAQIRALRDERETDLAAERKKLHQLRDQRKNLTADTELVSLLPALRALAEGKSSYRQASAQLEGLRARTGRAREELAEMLSRLGPDWTCERVRATDRSLFAREDLSRHEEGLHNAQLAFQAASDTLESANQEVEASEKAFAAANYALRNIPEPDAIMTGAQRDELRQLMGRLNDSRRLEQTRQQAFNSASEAFERALSQAKIAIDGENKIEDAARVLKDIGASQEEARKLAAELRTKQTELDNISIKSGRLEENAENIRLKAEATIADARSKPATTRDSLEIRGRALRSLRNLSAQISSAREKLQEIETRINNSPRPVRPINWILVVFGILLILGSGGLFLANYFWGLTEIAITGGPALTINSWMCYLGIACGVILLTFGFPPHGAEIRRYQREMASLTASQEHWLKKVEELDGQAEKLSETAGVSSLDPITLDATELLLERDKEQCVHDERSQRDAENLQRELSAIRMQLTGLQKEASLKEREIQQCRRKWLSLMDSLHITDLPSPESVATVFARVDTASIALGNVQATNRELEELWEELRLLESSIIAMPAINHKLEAAPVPLNLEEAVSQALEECREADIVREQRDMALASVRTMENGLETARRRQGEALARFEKAAEKLDATRRQWTAAISVFGLSENLSPQIMREALQLMDNALTGEEKVSRLEQEVTAFEKEKETFESALRDILERLKKPHDRELNHLALLDGLLEEAEDAAGIVNEQKRLDSLIGEHETEYGAKEAALETADSQLNALLRQGSAGAVDEFAQTARLVEEKRQLTAELANLESSLRVAAGGQDLEEFLAAFLEEDEASQEQKLANLEEELQKLNGRDQETATSLGNLEARVDTLATTDELASLRQDEAMLKASIESMAREWSKIALAEAILMRAKLKFEKERQPEVIRIASDIFSQITNRHWRGLKTSLEDARLEILDPHGESVPPWVLSRGAQEQAYLSLRLAYIRDHACHAEPLPMIMDEILVNFDPDRALRTARAFADLVQNPPENRPQQILYFTCQPHMVDILKSAAPDAGLFIVENGEISRAGVSG